MPDVIPILPNGGRAPRQRQVVEATVSTLQPAPTDFTDPLFVVFDYDPDHAIQIDNWPVIHGATLPALGAAVYLNYTDQHTWVCVGWAGVHS